MRRKFRFYTPEEVKRMLEVYKACGNQTEAARKLTKELNRPVHLIQVKLSLLLKNNGTAKRSSKGQNDPKGVTIPAGFTFDIKPSKAVMFNDHVRLYF
jgi:hypothetical protein